jgi:hypothetical protein
MRDDTSPATSSRRIALHASDAFILALDGLMRRTGQGRHISQSVVLLDAPPDRDKLEQAWREFLCDHPIVKARVTRRAVVMSPTWLLPREPIDVAAPDAAVGWWSLSNDGDNSCASLEDLCRTLRHRFAFELDSHWQIRLDVLDAGDRSAVVMSWHHLLLDGKGAELVLIELARRCGDANGKAGASDADPAFISPGKPGIRQRIQQSRAFAQHFSVVMRHRFSSLGGKTPHAGDAYCRVLTLDEATSELVRQRAAKLANPLMNMPFYLASAAYAHARVQEQRKGASDPQVISLPAQVRPKGTRGALFQNQVTVLFYHFTAEQLQSVETSTAVAQQQFMQMTRGKLGESMLKMLELMRPIPSRLYCWFLRKQSHGHITSFFHSHTGEFAPRLKHFAGAPVREGWHMPTVSTPPGTGLFLSERAGRITLSMSWREGALSEAEQQCLMDSFLIALVGERPANVRVDLTR